MAMLSTTQKLTYNYDEMQKCCWSGYLNVMYDAKKIEGQAGQAVTMALKWFKYVERV